MTWGILLDRFCILGLTPLVATMHCIVAARLQSGVTILRRKQLLIGAPECRRILLHPRRPKPVIEGGHLRYRNFLTSSKIANLTPIPVGNTVFCFAELESA